MIWKFLAIWPLVLYFKMLLGYYPNITFTVISGNRERPHIIANGWRISASPGTVRYLSFYWFCFGVHFDNER